MLTDVLVPYPNEIWSWTQLQMAWTRGHPGVTLPKSSHAVLASSSDGHRRLGNVKVSVSSGRSKGGTSPA